MSLQDHHPEYVERFGEWIQLTDTYEGERAVKAKRLDYLPACDGMIQDGMNSPQAPGWKDYESYLMRAVFQDVVKEAVKAMIGIMHSKPAIIKLPKKMEFLNTSATIQGEGLQNLLRRINVEQLVYGRCGLLADVPKDKPVDKALPYLALYNARRIINWDAGRLDEGMNELEMVVLDESGYRRTGFTWKTERKYRILQRGDGALEIDTQGRPADGYSVAVKVDDTNDPTPADFIFPAIGGQGLKSIPFVFIGANDLVPEPEVSPLLGLSNLSLAIYRAEADYRQTLYLQGQNTLVVVGGNVSDDAPGQIRVGNKGVIDLKIGGSAEYIGAASAGLSEMRTSLENDKKQAAMEGNAFLDVTSDTGQSGEALRIRVAARTTTVATVAKAGGAGLEQALKHIATWMGEDPAEVSVTPTTDFADQTVAGAALLAFMQAKQLGLPLSLRSMHRMMRLNDMTEMDFEEENKQIEEEAASMLGTMVSPFAGATDDTFLDDNVDPVAASGAGTPPGPSATAGQPAPGPGSTAPPNKNVPVKPSAGNKGYTRGSPVPLKRKVGPKGASNGKGGK